LGKSGLVRVNVWLKGGHKKKPEVTEDVKWPNDRRARYGWTDSARVDVQTVDA